MDLWEDLVDECLWEDQWAQVVLWDLEVLWAQ